MFQIGLFKCIQIFFFHCNGIWSKPIFERKKKINTHTHTTRRLSGPFYMYFLEEVAPFWYRNLDFVTRVLFSVKDISRNKSLTKRSNSNGAKKFTDTKRHNKPNAPVSNTSLCRPPYTHWTHIQAQWPKQVCEQLEMKEWSSSGDLMRKEKEGLVFFFFFPDFTQTRNAQASAAAWVNKRTGLTSLSPGPGACARQYSLCCCQRGCWGLKNYTLQLKGCLCWSAKAFLSILQPTACHVLGGRPPS